VTNQQIHLVSRPAGEASLEDFALVEASVPEVGEGQVLVRHHYLSLDPYMRGRMDDAKSYAPPQPLNAVMQGGTVGDVVASRSAAYTAGDMVVGAGGWQQFSIVDAGKPGALRKVDATRIPLQAYLGAVGMPGVTAWYGLTQICKPTRGQTVVVSAASGAVGGVVGQLARARGCRAVGIAGGAAKCGYVVNDLGFDACIDYKAHKDPKSLYEALKEATPDGIESYFENVGGPVTDAVMARMNAFGRIAACGMISGYDGEPIPMRDPIRIVKSRLTIVGFIVSEHLEFWPEALKELSARVAAGTLKYRESVAHGLASAPEAFLGLLKGRNFGKQIIKLV
jgi:NADPH-dependent curcumin reductase CurA